MPKKIKNYTVEELDRKIKRYDKVINKLNQRRWRLRIELKTLVGTTCKHKNLIHTGYYLHGKEILKCMDCGQCLR